MSKNDLMVKELAETAVEEAYGAHNYAKLAVENKHEYPQMAEAVANMAVQELAHSDTLIRNAKMILDGDHEFENRDGLEYLFDYLQEKTWDEGAQTRACLEKYKGM